MLKWLLLERGWLVKWSVEWFLLGGFWSEKVVFFDVEIDVM